MSNLPAHIIQVHSQLNDLSLNQEETKQQEINLIYRQLVKWLVLGISLMVSLIILQLRVFYTIPVEFSICPFFCSEIQKIFAEWKIYRKSPQALNAKKSLIKVGYQSICNLIFYLLLALFFITKSFAFTIISSFLCVFSLPVLFTSDYSKNSIEKYSDIVIFT